MNVRIYWNLNKDCVSIQDAKTRKVIGYAKSVLLENVSFVVSEANRQRAIRDKQRNVHAYACGTLTAADWIENKTNSPITWNGADTAKLNRRVSYNPFRAATFTIDNAPIYKTPRLYLTGNPTTKAQCYI